MAGKLSAMAHITVPDESTVTTFVVTTAQSVFSVPWTCFDKTDISILVNGVALLQTDFTFVGNPGAEGGFDGATITLNVAVSSSTVIIYRAIIVQRTEDFGAGPVSSRDRNTALDRLTAMMQDQDRRNDESLRVPVGETVPAIPSAGERANKVLGFDLFGNPIATTGGGGGGGGSDAVPLIASVAALRATTWPDGRPAAVMLLSNHTTGDGGGLFRWDSASTQNDNNGGTRVKEDATATGRWIRQINDGWVHASWFGLVLSADEATATANTTAMQRALNSGFNVRLPSGDFWCGLVTQNTAGQIVEGDYRTRWRHPAAVSGTLITINDTAIGAIWRNFRIDGNSANVTYAYNSSEMVWYATDVTIENIQFKDCQSMGARAIGPAHRAKVLRCRFDGCGDFGFFANDAGLGGAIDGVVDGNTVLNFGLKGLDSVGLAARSSVGGWKIVNNTVTQTTAVPAVGHLLGIEYWTGSNNGICANNVIDFSVAGDFGLSCSGYGMVVTGNLVRGSVNYAIEVVDRAATVTGNVVRSPFGAGIAVNLNSVHSDPGDVITITGNSVENFVSTDISYAAIVVAGDGGTTPIAITIAGNTLHGSGYLMLLSQDLIGFTVSGNTFYNTGSTLVALRFDGDDAAITGNNFVRVSAAGSGNQTEAIGVGANASGILISDNRFTGNSRMTNGITIQPGASNIYIGPNHFTGIISNSVFSSSTSPSVVVYGGMSNVGVGMDAANKVFGFLRTADNIFQSQNVMPGVSTYTVAGLPTNVQANQIAYASNGRKNGEGAGSGTGVMVFRDGTAWRACDTGATVAA